MGDDTEVFSKTPVRIRCLATTAILSSVLAVAVAPALAATKQHHKHRPTQAEPVSNASAVSPAKYERSAPSGSTHRAGSATGGDSSTALLAANRAAIATYESQIAPVANRSALYLRVDCSGAATLLTCTGEWYPSGATGAPKRLAPLQYTYSNGRLTAVPQ
jgi:hypothetical protein